MLSAVPNAKFPVIWYSENYHPDKTQSSIPDLVPSHEQPGTQRAPVLGRILLKDPLHSTSAGVNKLFL